MSAADLAEIVNFLTRLRDSGRPFWDDQKRALIQVMARAATDLQKELDERKELQT